MEMVVGGTGLTEISRLTAAYFRTNTSFEMFMQRGAESASGTPNS